MSKQRNFARSKFVEFFGWCDLVCRFRQHEVAVMGDVEKMFYQVKLPESHQDFFRFVWWPGGDSSQPLQEFRMTVHILGCISSPSCANYALKRTADDNKDRFSNEDAKVMKRDFYFDDFLHSADDAKTASNRLSNIKQLSSLGGFNLHKFISNSREVL